MKCAIKGCGKAATSSQAEWKAYAMGYPKVNRYAITGSVGIATCDEHQETLRNDASVWKETISITQSALIAARRQPLDPDTLEISFPRLQ